jgi:hydrogenase expression/formation protein HypE
MAAREGLEFESAIESDCAPLTAPVLALIREGVAVRCLRDLTRGGLASAVVEIAQAAGLHIHLHEAAIPVREDVRGACEILGFDPMYVANEGRFIAFVPQDDINRALDVLRKFPLTHEATVVGSVLDATRPLVTLTSPIGATRIIEMLTGEQLPRIC